ncbi:MAG: carbamoyl phosphate synthase large subunit [Acidobacteria bacterium]|nr:MAG: carbamoyl phosphate synthase large subunit [Acidobacteriota bacterium]PIE89700.1 MAG: carbamoyl phosphate synthase large subunit [Acidobacteriota bacterium]
MPRDKSIQSVLLIGSGPITIGQACEFDYSGVQAARALREEGVKVILVNSNPATVMTDLNIADRTYIEPLTPSFLTEIIRKERPDALLPTMGGQTALNLSLHLQARGVLDKYNVRIIGASVEAINLGEDREKFKDLMARHHLDTCRGGFATSMAEAEALAEEIGFPIIIRPSFTLGGSGGGVAYDWNTFREIASNGLRESANTQILVEESILGWKEYEFEVVRDKADNAVIICSIENIDAMGVHTGDSITVAPAMTLTDRQYHTLRDMSLTVLRAVGVDTGGSNVQFAIDPHSERIVIVEMNPRVSRSSALASKATGYPIAKVAAKLALGYTLDELDNEITGCTPASFEPAIDYVVVKVPRWAFEKFPNTNLELTTQMKSVGQVMSMGRTFKEALQKAIQSLETGFKGFPWQCPATSDPEQLNMLLETPNWRRMHAIASAFRQGRTVEEVSRLTRIDPWFLTQIQELIETEKQLRKRTSANQPIPPELIAKAKRQGFQDDELADLLGREESDIRELRSHVPYGFKSVDSCAGEFPSRTPYLYGTYGETSEIEPLEGRKVVILGSGPNRIGQGIEFDYSCVRAVTGFQNCGFQVIMINCNPETVSTDFDVADRLYFEPMTWERVRHILDFEQPEGVIVSFGGQTALNLAEPIAREGYPIMGTSFKSIQLAEDREKFNALLNELGLKQPKGTIAFSLEEAEQKAKEIGYPVMIRPSFVLGGRAMSIVFDQSELDQAMYNAFEAAGEQPVLIDMFLDDAVEIDVDAISDGTDVLILGVMQHIEETGIHSGDSSCCLPAPILSRSQDRLLREATRKVASALGVVGLINIQFALWNDELYIIEANPRCSRTVPFAAKSTGIPFAQLSAEVIAGRKLKDLVRDLDPAPAMWHVKSPVFPFKKLAGEDPLAGPEMKSTGEVMGVSFSFGNAFAKAYRATGHKLPRGGRAFISVNNRDKKKVLPIAMALYQLGFELCATAGTARFLSQSGLEVEAVTKLHEGGHHIHQRMIDGEIQLVINTPVGKMSHHDDRYIRSTALLYGIPCLTTLTASRALVEGIRAIKSERMLVHCLQDMFTIQKSSPQSQT